jgi:hypothetical protein
VETGLRLAFIQSLGRHAFVAAQVDGLCNVVIWRVTLDQQPLNQALVWASPRFAGSVGLDAGLRFP